MSDRLLILAPGKGFSMAANPMVSFTLTPDRYWLQWQRKIENFNRKTGYNWSSVWDIFLIIDPIGGFRVCKFNGVSEICLRPTPCCHGVTLRPRRYRPRPVTGTELPGPQRRTIPAVVGRQDGRFGGYRGAIDNTWFWGPPYMRCGYLHFTSFGAG